jgi:hypothetical protein
MLFLPFISIVVPFVLQNRDLLKETGQLFTPVVADIAHNKTQAGNCNLIQ